MSEVDRLRLQVEIERERLRLQEQGEVSPAAAQAAPPDQLSANTIAQIGAGFNEGLANLVGLPVDVVTAGLNAVGFDIKNPIGGSDSIKKLLQISGIPDAPAKTTADRIVRRISGEAGAAVLTGGIPLGLATQGARAVTAPLSAATRTGRLAQGAGRAFVEPAIGRPAAFAATELGLGAAAGTGAGIAGETARQVDAGPGAQTAAELGGALAGAGGVQLAANVLKRGILGVVGAVKGPGEQELSRAARTNVAQQLETAAADPDVLRQQLAAGIEEAAETGITPTTAQIEGGPGLATLENRVASTSAEVNIRITRAQAESNTTLREALTESAPPNIGPDAVKKEINARVGKAVESIDERLSVVQEEIEALTLRGVSREEASETAKTHLKTAAEEFRVQTRQNFDAVDPAGTAAFTPKFIKGEIKTLRQTRPKAEAPGDTPEDIFQSAESAIGKGKTISFEELRALRSRIGQQIRDEESLLSPNRNKIRKLVRLQGSIQKTLDSKPVSGDPSVAENYQKARAFHAQGSAKFREGPVARSLRARGSSVADSATLDKFFHSRAGAKEDMAQFIKASGGKPEAIGAVNDFAMRKVIDTTADVNGIINRKKLLKWISNHSAALDQLPSLKKQLGEVERLQARADNLVVRKEKPTAAVQRNAAALFLKDDPAGAMRKVLSSPNPVKEAVKVRQLVRNDPDALMGLKRGLWDEFMAGADSPNIDMSGSPFLKPFQMDAFLEENIKVFRALGFGQTDIQNYRKIIRAAKTMSKTKVPTTVSPPAAGIADKPVFTVNQILSRLYGIQRGVVGTRFVASELGARFLNKIVTRMSDKQIRETLEQALVDPKFAADLLAPTSGANGEQLAKKIHAYLLTHGIIGTGLDEPEEPEPISPEIIPAEPTTSIVSL